MGLAEKPPGRLMAPPSAQRGENGARMHDNGEGPAPAHAIAANGARGGDLGPGANGFSTLLFPGGSPPSDELSDRSFALDLNLDQVANELSATWEEQELLLALFYRQLHDAEVVRFRHEVFRDLESDNLFQGIESFEEGLRRVRSHLTALGKMRSSHHRNGWHLDAVALYCDAVRAVAQQLHDAQLESRGLLSFREFLDAYSESESFTALEAETRQQKAALASIRYCIRIRGLRVDVSRYAGEDDYSAEVLRTFDRFKQGAVKDYRVAYRGWPGMNHVGEQILELVAKLFEEEFSSLAAYCARHRDFYHPLVRRFDQEVQFYLSYLDYVRPMRSSGLSFCYPDVGEHKDVFAADTFDLALARKLTATGKSVVTNEMRLSGDERVIVVSGPNQGGKTTFARTFGQLHHLASLGYPVPGTAARLALFDRLFTHFGREEDLDTMAGKLEEDLLRIREILLAATSDSIVVMNEAFSSTALQDATFLGRKALEKIIQLDLLAVYVTFVDELASLGPSVVSMVSTIVPDNPAERTFKVVRGPADGLAYAMAIAEKYDLTYERLRERVRS